MRFSTFILSSAFILNTGMFATPLPSNNSLKEACDKLYQDCVTAAGSSPETVLSTFSSASPTLEPEASSSSVALVEPTSSLIITPAARKNTRAAQPGGHKGSSKNTSKNESTPNDNSRGNALANEVLIAVSD
ncbi:hypothetical protein SISNIDRAFT_456980 [Sistotremastrum niveocremeum HHB9708]|uniref:Uncharacterized protein n=1 Tax=Sistotremastrum niveocremeum HHB9708 TaxID=1314777 RepID=A0A164RYC4_9AGAM|nr:hypothetical protein SISNIDRAFT_456980 [Sistotremastrum niveocremeum HHB9708]